MFRDLFQKIFKNNQSENNSEHKVVTRIAPSPTGFLHIGTARAALFNYLYARKNKGKFILRIEDTDKERSKKEFEDDILNGLKWLGLEHDEFHRQSERTEVYKKYLNKLISSGKAYVSNEKNREGSNWTEGQRETVIRFKNPNQKITFQDEIRGEITFDTTELGDFVIAKSKEEPLYHLAVVVDDHEMGVTHIIRGEDGISNTPRQILLQQAIGAKTPVYAHLPLVLGKDRSKLSKRHGATSLNEFKKQGYLNSAIVNQLAFLGWNPGTEKEVYTLDELIHDFDLKQVSKGGAIFNQEKLDWFNKEHLKLLPQEEIFSEIRDRLKEQGIEADDSFIKKVSPIILERINRFDEIRKMIKEGELEYYFQEPEFENEKLIWKNGTVEESLENLKAILPLLEKISDDPEIEEAKSVIWPLAEEKGKGNVLWPLRVALSGKDKSPDPFTLIHILGKSESIKRLKRIIMVLFLIFSLAFAGLLTVTLEPKIGLANQEEIDALTKQIQEKQQKLAELDKEIERQKAAIMNTSNKANNLQSKINELEASRKKILTDIEETSVQIEKTELTLNKIGVELTEKQKSINLNSKALGETIRQVNQLDMVSPVERFLGYENMSEYWLDMEQSDKLQRRLHLEVEKLLGLHQELKEKEVEKEAEKQELSQQKKILSGEQEAVDSTKKEQQTLLVQTKNEEASYQKVLEEKLAEKKRFEQEILDIESKIKIYIDPNSYPNPRNGILAWPLPGTIRVTQEFGGTQFAKTNPGVYSRPFHPGSDFGTPIGTQVFSVDDGTVRAWGNTDAYSGCYAWGKWILVDHDNGLSSLYAHLSSVTVNKGDRVTRGSIIGLSGNSGVSTGPHLHLSLYASQGVEIRQYTGNTGCGNAGALGPFADLDAYLDPLGYLPSCNSANNCTYNL